VSAAAAAKAPPAVLFDLDGTLTDSRPGIVNSALYALRRFNKTRGANLAIPRPESLTFLLGPPLQESFAKLVGPADAPALVALYRERYDPVGMLENSVFPGVIAALEALAAMNYRLFVATSKNEIYARRILEHFGLARFFADIHGAEPDGHRSNKGELIAYVLKRHTIDPPDAAMIGDREHDAWGAKKAGVWAIGVLWGYGSREELTAAGADPLLESPNAIAPALAKGRGDRIPLLPIRDSTTSVTLEIVNGRRNETA
jgi:phosphoglycolate phosphatase